ncbi:hypothetical protein GIB67_002174 [Kingdonia uniflora]|uniref:Uncharacterized protein n=1 Tax=Kingdonia uniflora TaxID=39325 RepID=A0A7J7KWN0_9MAGN|nr:hypothetical protein GIB67_002174 [Kingdonia uniflora]
MAKKRRGEEAEATVTTEEIFELVNGDTNKTKKKKKKKKKKKEEKEKGKEKETEKEVCTVSIAVAGSIIDNAQSFELATRLAGQIARAATIFRIDEVVVFDNKSAAVNHSNDAIEENADESGAPFLVRILKYLETPQYLRRSLFPRHNSLRLAGLLPPLDAPHHLRQHEWGPYREGMYCLKKISLFYVGCMIACSSTGCCNAQNV